MAKSARASRIKKNKTALRKRVFGPVEAARNERLSAKLMELAKAPKPAKEEMEVESNSVAKEHAKKDAGVIEDTNMDVDDATLSKRSKSKREIQRQRAQRIEKRQRKPRNQVKFPTHGKKGRKR